MQVDKEIEKQYIKFIDSHKKEMIDLWRAIVRIESPSYFKEGVDKVGAVIHVKTILSLPN